MNHSESIKELAGALAKAQKQIKPAQFDAVNPHFKSRYATLASVMEACRGPLSDNGLAVTQCVNITETDVPILETVLMHVSGEWISSRIRLLNDKNNMQGLVAATTYARRLGLASLVGVVADEDDDGNASVDNPAGPMPIKPSTPALHIHNIVKNLDNAAIHSMDPNSMPEAPPCPVCGAPGKHSKYKAGEFFCSEWKNGCQTKF